jgi:hypothetical protein
MRSPLTGEALSSEMTVLSNFCIKAVSRMANFDVVELNEKKPIRLYLKQIVYQKKFMYIVSKL